MARRARVHDLEYARVEALARELAPVLAGRGEVRARILEVEDVNRWRAAARRAGRITGHPVRTWTDYGWVFAVALDMPVPPGAEDAAAKAIEDAIFNARIEIDRRSPRGARD
jgi:hypothetical protein